MQKVLFLGRKAVATEALRWLYSQSDIEIVGVVTDSHLPVSTTKDFAQEVGLPLFTRESVEYHTEAGGLKYDLAVSMLYWQKIRAPVLDTSSKGVINFHPAPLPDYKGTGGYNIAILNNLPEWAVSAHYVDCEIDTGPIIKVDRFPINQTTETAQSLELRCRAPLLDLFKSVVRRAIDSNSKLQSINNSGGIYISRLEMEAMKKIQPGDDIERKIRAFWFPPYDGAYIDLENKKYTLVSRNILHSLADPSVGNIFMQKDENTK